jgi:hypothetical protein
MVRIDINKYKNDGWGLSKLEFDLLYDELKKIDSDKEFNVVEFGSGRSTEFLIDVKNVLIQPKLKICSFDDSTEYAYKGRHEDLILNIVPLVDTEDSQFEEMFLNKKYERLIMRDKLTPVHTRQKNTFYKVDESQLPENIDLLIVDGPHGNGRSLAYLHCMNKLKNGSLILIDDASHYPFYEHLNMLCKTEIIYEQHVRDKKWENGGDFILCKIIKNV